MQTDPEPLLPFGRYKGTPLAQVPLDYLKWLAHG